MIKKYLTNEVCVLSSEEEGLRLQKVLDRKRIIHTLHHSLESFCNSISKSAVLLITKDFLQPSTITRLGIYIDQQPKWSQLPVVLLIDHKDLDDKEFLDELNKIENLILLERPINDQTFTSVIQSCLKNRDQQYEMRDLLYELAETKTDVEKAEKAKNEFLANMSHEIRTPLGAVMGFSDLICQARLTHEEREEYALTIKRNGQQLTNLIEDILDIVKVESGKLTIEEREFNLDDLLLEVVNSLHFRSLLKNIPISIKKDESVPEIIKTDPTRLKQVLCNLLQNAIKFTVEGQIIIKVSVAEQNLIFEVIDTGIGIASENHEKLFQAFFQADGSVTRKFGGTGLGLALSKKLAKALGGDLHLKSSYLGQGSVFQFSIKCVQPQQLNLFSNKATKSPLPKDSLKGLKILVADDSADNQSLLSQILTKEGAVVEIAADGEEAVHKALEDDFNIVLMDVQMPKLSGLEATKMLRKEGYPKPIVALSAYAMTEDRIRGLSAGCDLYLTKPVDKKKLLTLLQTYSKKSDATLPYSSYPPHSLHSPN